MSADSDPDRLEHLARYVLDVPPNTTMTEVSVALNDAAVRIRGNQADLASRRLRCETAEQDADRLARQLRSNRWMDPDATLANHARAVASRETPPPRCIHDNCSCQGLEHEPVDE